MRVQITFVALLLTAGMVQSDWILETLDSGGTTGYWTSIRLDSSGFLHITYLDETDNALMHIWQNGAGWVSEIVDNCDCWFMAMALDSQDMPRIVYWDHTDETISAVRWTGTEWETEVVASAAPSTLDWPRTDIEMDSLDRAHVVWYDGTDTALHYAVRETGGLWNLTVVESTGDTGIDPSLCLDSQDLPRVSFGNRTDGHLYYASLEGTEWQVQLVDSVCEEADWTSLELDQTETPHILYHRFGDLNDSPVNSINLASLETMGWSTETVLTGNYIFPGSPQGLLLDTDNYPHICRYSAEYELLGYSYEDGSGWNHEWVDGPGGAGWDSAICLDAFGNPNISYFQFANEDLRWAHRQPTGIWSTHEIILAGQVSIAPVINPASGRASVLLQLKEAATVIISVYDITGRLREKIPATGYPPGAHTLILEAYPPGIYFCTAETEDLRTETCLTIVR
jgi:hypothetical protein